ncbi:xanthine dehydrogenase family protein molybdopterin-binding subunit [bacterium]|nr:MAG: xanthine dehydrogenase family protein molybdopterin-binding subunit [bacterium]
MPQNQGPKKEAPQKKDPLFEVKETGAPKDRRDGVAKVTGGAKFSAEHNLPDIAHAVLVESPIAKGTLRSIDIRAAEALPGVLKVYTPFNVPKTNPGDTNQNTNPTANASKKPGPLEEKEIHHFGQYIAVVVADTLEVAQHGASLLRPDFSVGRAIGDLKKAKTENPEGKVAFEFGPDSLRGDPNKAMRGSAVRIQNEYVTPFENHNAIEPHATVAVWEGDKLTLYDATQNTYGTRDTLAKMFGIPPEDVHVLTPYIGGAFGSKGTMWPHVPVAVLAAREVKRPVKLSITRAQMFTNVGGRAKTEQSVSFGADRAGDIKALIHEGKTASAEYQEYIEAFTKATHMMVEVPDARFSQRVGKMNIVVPTYMRAPGEASGMFGLECGLDELAWELGIDPIELRALNEPKVDPEKKVPFSTRSLIPAFREGATKFGWEKRSPKPRSMREGRLLIGMGCSSATYPENRFAANAKAKVMKDGRIVVSSSTHEMGTGTATAQAQLAADFAGTSYDRVTMEYGDTALPFAPVSGGSATTASVGTAIHASVRNLQAKIVELLAANPQSPLYGPQGVAAAAALKMSAMMGNDAPPGQDPKAQLPTGAKAEPAEVGGAVVIGNGRISLKSDPSKFETYESALARLGVESMEAEGKFAPPPRGGSAPPPRSMHSFGANFCEVSVDEDLGTVRVRRFLGVYGAGRILNMKTGTSQMKGGIVMGIGQALMEETIVDHRDARYVNPSLGEYHVPVNRDIPVIDIVFLPEEDPYVNPMGTKGIGEIGIVGVAAAVANAVYHATGKRIRELPITPDKLL